MALALLIQAPATALPPPSSPPIVVTAPVAPDIAPMHAAVATCDREAMGRLNKAEPHRRAEFTAHAYTEQRTIAALRAALPIAITPLPSATPAAASAPVARAAPDIARAAIDARQKRLDDARATEQAWRSAVEEMRADFLANCGRKPD